MPPKFTAAAKRPAAGAVTVPSFIPAQPAVVTPFSVQSVPLPTVPVPVATVAAVPPKPKAKAAKKPKAPPKEGDEAKAPKVAEKLGMDVQLSKCVSTVKNVLNRDLAAAVQAVEDKHRDIVEQRAAMAKEIARLKKETKDAALAAGRTDLEAKEAAVSAAASLKEALVAFSKTDAYVAATKEIRAEKGKLVRINHRAALIVALAADRMVNELFAWGLSLGQGNLKKELLDEIHKHKDDLRYYHLLAPLIPDAKTRLDAWIANRANILAEHEKKPVPEGEKKKRPPITSGTFHTLGGAKFKKLKNSDGGSKVTLSTELRELVSSLVELFLESIGNTLYILLNGGLVKVRTVSPQHVYAALQLRLSSSDVTGQVFGKLQAELSGSIDPLFMDEDKVREDKKKERAAKRAADKAAAQITEANAPQ